MPRPHSLAGLPGPGPRVRFEAGGEDPAGLDGVVEGEALAGHLLVRLVALSRNDHDIARPRRIEGKADGDTAVRLDDDPRVGPLTRDAAQHFLNDGQRVLEAWVVGREERQIAQIRRRRAHQGPLGPVPVPPAAEDTEHPA